MYSTCSNGAPRLTVVLVLLILSPVEMQAVAGCPLLPHVDVLPHGAVAAAGRGADSSQDALRISKVNREVHFKQLFLLQLF